MKIVVEQVSPGFFQAAVPELSGFTATGLGRSCDEATKNILIKLLQTADVSPIEIELVNGGRMIPDEV